MKNALVLFDIDGTLITAAPGRKTGFGQRHVIGIKRTWGIDAVYDAKRLDGLVEREIVWKLVREKGVDRDEFLQKLPTYLQETARVLEEKSKKEQLFVAISPAADLARQLFQKGVAIGVITGNAEGVARWKLRNVGINDRFPFGVFGDEADSRVELAKLIFDKAKEFFGKSFQPQDVVLIGDTPHDIAAARAIGAHVIAVSSGAFYSVADLAKENPDLAVRSLDEAAVMRFLDSFEALGSLQS